jgi:hypothetical protein
MIKYSDVYVQALARGLCNPGEQFVAAGAASYQSFWTFQIPWFKHSYLFIATNERLIVVDHRRGLIFDRMDAVQSFRWSDIGGMKISGLLSKKVIVRDLNNRPVLKAKLPPFLANPFKNNLNSLRAVVQTWEQQRSLGAAPAYGQLPQQAQQQAYGAPVYQAAPPPPAPRQYS